MSNSIHQFTIEGIDGKDINFADFKGKKILIVNVASRCGYTPQYQQMQELFEQHQDKLVVIGFPANNFGGQEPGSNDQIREFCSTKYNVTFPMTTKIDIATNPIYQWLTEQAQKGGVPGQVKWNFHKFLLDEAGELVSSFPSSVKPAKAVNL